MTPAQIDFFMFLEALVDLLQTIVDLEPKCCEPSHLFLILGAYNAKLGLTGWATSLSFYSNLTIEAKFDSQDYLKFLLEVLSKHIVYLTDSSN